LSGGADWKLREDGKRSSTFFEMLAGRLELTIWIAASTLKKPSLARCAVVSPKDSIMEAYLAFFGQARNRCGDSYAGC
jgi:hypothetical protein